MAEDTPLNRLEEQARLRQERLKSLRQKSEKQEEGNERSVLKPKFRSYAPQDQGLAENALPKPNLNDVRTEVKDLLDLAKKEMVIDQLDIATLAPRQPDWDLKRDVAHKLEKLERRTQRAMAELIRERLRERQDLAEIVNGPTT